MYGGRAIDDFDRRILRTYMDEYMGDFIFDTFQPFHFYNDEHVDYHIPADGSRDVYVGQSSMYWDWFYFKIKWWFCRKWLKYWFLWQTTEIYILIHLYCLVSVQVWYSLLIIKE